MPAPQRAAIDASAGRTGRTRHLRAAGALLRSVRSQPHTVAASLRACAWGKPRSRPGDGGSDRALSQPWPRADRRRAAGLPAAVPGVHLPASGHEAQRAARRTRGHSSLARGPARHARQRLCRCVPGAARHDGKRARGRAFPIWSRTIRTISWRWTRHGRKRRSISAPASKSTVAAPIGCGRGFVPPPETPRPPEERER